MRVQSSTKHTISLAIVFLLLFTLIPSQVAHASTTETYYSGVGDGDVSYGGASVQAWATVHHATSGEVVDYTSTATLADSSESSEGSGWNSITRAFFPFNTAALPDTATITAATLNIYVYTTVDDDNDGYDYVSVVNTTQASTSSLILHDYDQCGAIQSPQKGATDIDITGISAGYLTFTLNATGISWINLTGWTQLGIREGHDVADHQIGANKADTVGFYSSEYTGTSKDPYLSITYTVPTGGWHDVSTWTASLVARTWSSGTSWTANLIARTWSSGTSWQFGFGTKIWTDVVIWTYSLMTMAWQNISWIFYLGTSIWTDIATWSINLSTIMWNDVAAWVLYPITRLWNDIAVWLFTLSPPQWLNVAVWTFSLRSPEWMLVALWNLQLGETLQNAKIFVAAAFIMATLIGIPLLVLVMSRRRS